MNAALHESNPNYGASSGRWAGVVRELSLQFASRDVLDYGCGKRRLQEVLPEFSLRHYDPAIPGLDAAPSPADILGCTDVLEHVESELIDHVLDDLARLTLRVGFFTVATRPAVKVLADGRNAHLIQQPMTWWLSRFEARFQVVRVQDMAGLEFSILVHPLVDGPGP